MNIFTKYAAIAALAGALADPAAVRAEEPAGEKAPGEETRLNQQEVLEEVAKMRRSLKRENYWVRRGSEGKDICYNGRDVNVEFTEPSFGTESPAQQETLVRSVFNALKELGYNPVDMRSYTHPLTGRIRVEYRGRKAGEQTGGLSTVILTLKYDENFRRINIYDNTFAGRYAHTFSGLSGVVDRDELYEFVKNAIPPVCDADRPAKHPRTVEKQ